MELALTVLLWMAVAFVGLIVASAFVAFLRILRGETGGRGKDAEIGGGT